MPWENIDFPNQPNHINMKEKKILSMNCHITRWYSEDSCFLFSITITSCFPLKEPRIKTSFLGQGQGVVLNEIGVCLMSWTLQCWMSRLLKYIDGYTGCYFKVLGLSTWGFHRLWADLSATGGRKAPRKNSWLLYLHTTVCPVVTFLLNRKKAMLETSSQKRVGGKGLLEVYNSLLLHKV